jgi:8-oxo-dGTP pyrophosphatase MutT (NUDIX family)
MFEQVIIDHHIQRHIIGVLMFQKQARFRDLRPPKTDTNLFTYHLKVLLKNGLVSKTDSGYTLSQKGMSYVDRVSTERFLVRSQPKVITMMVVQNSDGDVLLQRRTKQPNIDTWTLPYGKLHIDDSTIEAAAKRETFEKLGFKNQPLTHAGDCYIRVKSGGAILSTTLAHVFRFNSDAIVARENIMWARPHKLANNDLAPAVEAIVTRTFFGDDHFFEEFEEDWYN